MQLKWAEILGYEGLYWISNKGGIRGRQKALKPWDKSGYGHMAVKLYKNRKSRTFYVHQLVAKEFVKNPFPDMYMDVNHIDSDPTNNSAENLEWCDQSANVKHAVRNNRMNKNGCIVYDTQTKKYHLSIDSAAKAIGVKPNTLVCSFRRGSGTHGRLKLIAKKSDIVSL